MSLSFIAPAIAFQIAGTPVPLAAVRALPQVAFDIAAQAPPGKIAEDLAPAAGAACDLFVLPGCSIVIRFAVFIVVHGKKPTRIEQQRMWDRAQGLIP